jgi:tetratricopeptide (TPR) repeat protein
VAVELALILLAGGLVPTDACELRVGGRQEPSAYLDAVRLYRDHHRDLAMRSLAGLDSGEVDRLVERIDSLREKFQQGAIDAFVPDDVCFEAASLLEAELGMSLVETSRWDEADAHFDAGWRVSFLVDSPNEQRRFQRDWLLAVGLFHQERIFMGADPQPVFERADRFLRNATRRYPEDFEVLLAAGALLEFAGSLAEGNRDHLKEAEVLYAQALRIRPDDPEALVRHGWALKKLGKIKDAEAPLRRALELAPEAILIYRARMALGGLAESSGRLDEAATEYEAATEVEPDFQVAYLAWSEVLHRKGAHARAREILAAAIGDRSSEAGNDSWWEYELGLVRLGEPLLRRMREEAVK